MKVLLTGACGVFIAATCMGGKYYDPKEVKENDGVMNGPLVQGG